MSLGCGVFWLAVAVVATLGVVVPAVRSQHGSAGVEAAVVAAVVCWLSGGLALASLMWWRRQNLPIQGALSAIGVRTFIPLGAGVFLSSRGGALAEAGVFGLIVVFYLVTLVVDTLISVKIVGSPRSVTPPSQANSGQ